MTDKKDGETQDFDPLDEIHERVEASKKTARPDIEAEYVAPITAAQEAVCDIWKEVLGLERIGIHDDFLELGGQSLHAVSIASRIREDLQVEVTIEELFGDRLTVEALAEVVEDRLLDSVSKEELEEEMRKLEGMSEEEAEKILQK